MSKSDGIAMREWLKKRYTLLFLKFNDRTSHAFAIVDLPDLPPNPPEHPFDCKISMSTPRQAENDFIMMGDFDQGSILFDCNGWKKRLQETRQ